MRHPAVLSVLISLAIGCGGAATGPVTPPPPPPPGAPASLVILAGDGQQGVPGSLLPVAPSVTVRDAAGRAVPNVSVSFAVDSGGGTVSSASALSGADGVAQAGSWRLGLGEGRQVILAAAGSIPKAKFVAASLIPDVSYAPQTVATTGGTVGLSRPGLPLDGFELRIPSGALTAATSVALTVRSSAAITLPTGVTAATPLVRIAATTGGLTQPAIVRIPYAGAAGRFRAVGMRQAGSSEFTYLPTIVSDANGITVALPELGPVPAGAALFQAGEADDGNWLEVAGLLMPNLFIAGDFDTGYRPGVDDWDFARQPIAGIPGKSPRPTIDPGEAMLGTSLWYFKNQKKTGGALWQRFQEAPGIPESNRRGLRWVGVAEPTFFAYWGSSDVVTQMNTEAAARPVEFFGNQVDYIRMGLKQGEVGLGPVPVLLFSGSSIDAPRMALAFRLQGKVVDLAIPDQPGQTFHAEFDDAFKVMKPFTVATQGGGVFTVTGIGIAAFFNKLIENGVAAQWPAVVSGTIGNQDGWPSTVLRGEVRSPLVLTTKVDLDNADLILGTSLTHWWKCPTCAESGYVGGTTDDHKLVWRRASRRADGSYAALTPTFDNELYFSAADLKPALAATTGFALYQPGPGSGINTPNGTAWLDWKNINYRRLPTTLTPADPQIIEETDFTFTGSVQNAPPGVKYRWDVSAPGEFDTYALSPTPTLDKRVSKEGETRVVMMVLDGVTGREIATDTSKVNFEQKPLTIAPSPLNGTYDTDYQLTATYGLPLPPNPSWVWDLGDGRSITTLTNQVTIRYPAPVPVAERSFPLKVTLKSGTANEAVVRLSAAMGAANRIYTAWKITTLSASVVNDTRAYTDAGLTYQNLPFNLNLKAQQIYSFFGRDSASFFSMAQQHNGALVWVVRDTAWAGGPADTGVPAGVYWWPYGSWPASGAVPLSRVIEPINGTVWRTGLWNATTSCDVALNPSYTAQGNPTSATVSGLNWVRLDWANLTPGNYVPHIWAEYSVSIANGVMTGTYTINYRLVGDCSANPILGWGYRANFTATKIP